MKLRDLIFDLDGTLVDSAAGIQWSVEQALEECAFPPLGESIAPLLGPPIRDILAHVTGASDPAELNKLERAFRISYDNEGWCMTRCFPGTVAALDTVEENGFGLWLVTNKPSVATGRILSALGIAGYFRETLCRDSAFPAYGSKAEMLADLVKRRGLKPAQSLMIGDTTEDAEAARATGMRCRLVRYGIANVLMEIGA